LIMALYRASQAGVKIDLIVRGMCALRPGVRGVSHNITVRSIVGRFLEHSRIFYFANGGEEEIYLASADWMPRNLYDRVEAMFPLEDSSLRNRVKIEILDSLVADNVKSRLLNKDGVYERVWRAQGKRKPPTESSAFSAQDFFIAMAEGKATLDSIPSPTPVKPRKTPVGKVR
jgi:polyphosphate kinase